MLVDINFYHKALLTKNILLNTDKITKKLKINVNNSSREILLESYNYYIKNLKKIRKMNSGSDKNPSLKILNLLRLFSFIFK